MKNLKKSSVIIVTIVTILMQFSCDTKVDQSVSQDEINNTLKSVSLWQDSIGINPTELLADFEKVNIAIDSIGYPNAGYKIWEVTGEDSLGFRFMIEGLWPDQKTYDLIHNHELYKKVVTVVENGTISRLKNTWYYRFNHIK
ncbi:MAG: hypothetical protein KAQ79_19055 [Cyclobacteriaceae bacterium]|nr:hypothetical protein [Cyclobacteriaceae bacterium]